MEMHEEHTTDKYLYKLTHANTICISIQRNTIVKHSVLCVFVVVCYFYFRFEFYYNIMPCVVAVFLEFISSSFSLICYTTICHWYVLLYIFLLFSLQIDDYILQFVRYSQPCTVKRNAMQCNTFLLTTFFLNTFNFCVKHV